MHGLAYKMAVSNLQGLVDAISHLAGGGLPGTVSQLSAGKRFSAHSPRNAQRGGERHSNTYGILWPVLSVTVLPEDILMEAEGWKCGLGMTGGK